MDKATFEHLVRIPGNVSENEAMLLEDLAKVFPYCQSAHLLLAKESQQKKSMLFPKKLRKASTYILDRRVLHHLLHAQEPVLPLEVTEVLKDESEQVEIATTKSLSILQELEETLRVTRERKKMHPIAVQGIEPLPPITETKINEGQKDNSNAEDEHLFWRTESRLGEELHVSTTDNDGAAQTLYLFLDYLKSRATKPSIIEQEPIKSQVSVIEKFLETDPKMTRPIASMLSEEEANDLSRDSTELKIELTTENYALILIKQNKIEKAKGVYKKLMLKYPDKSSYFAAKLNELENR